MWMKSFTLAFLIGLSTMVSASLNLEAIDKWDKDVIDLAVNRVHALQLSCGLEHPEVIKVDILEEVYIQAEEAKKVPPLALLNNNYQLHDQLLERARLLPIQYYTLYIMLSKFGCAQGILVKKFPNI